MALFETYLRSHQSWTKRAVKPFAISAFLHSLTIFLLVAYPLFSIKTLSPPTRLLGVFEAAPPPPPPPPPPGGSSSPKTEKKPKTPDQVKEPQKVEEVKKEEAPKNEGTAGGVEGGVVGGVEGGVVGGVLGGVVGGSLSSSAKPDYARNPPPEYPNSSRRREEEGVVLLSVVVSATGDALSVEIAKSSGYAALDQAALEAVRRWKFLPGKIQGAAVQQKVLVPVRFKLDN